MLQVHDEFVVECKEEEAELVAKKMESAMISSNIIFFDTIPNFFNTCPFTVDVSKPCNSWGEGK